MRRYETFLIIDPDITKDEQVPIIERVKELIAQMDGFLVQVDDWGDRKLAYAIKKKERGYYVRFDYCGAGSLVNEIERFFRIDDRALKYMTVLLDKFADLEKIKEEMAKAESKSDVDSATEIIEDVGVESPPAEAVAEETEPIETKEEA
jgi:small subunit ribosomal protein S6